MILTVSDKWSNPFDFQAFFCYSIMEMDPKDQEIKELLEENLELNKENNDLLQGMARAARWGMIFNFIKWAAIIGSVFGLYYYFGQFFSATINTYKDLIWNNGETAQTSTSTKSTLETLEAGIDRFQKIIHKF